MLLLLAWRQQGCRGATAVDLESVPSPEEEGNQYTGTHLL